MIPYDGIAEVLTALGDEGVTLVVATSKPEYFAHPIVEHLGLTSHFTTICGDELDGSLPSKALVIDKALHRLGRPDPTTVLMIGDRSHDVLGAKEHGITCIGAGWGYGSPDELQLAGATPILASATELAAHLLRG